MGAGDVSVSCLETNANLLPVAASDPRTCEGTPRPRLRGVSHQLGFVAAVPLGVVLGLSAQGGVGSATRFSAGFAPAMMVAAAWSLLGACAGLALPARQRAASTRTAQNA